jgi:hypothetical protein
MFASFRRRHAVILALERPLSAGGLFVHHTSSITWTPALSASLCSLSSSSSPPVFATSVGEGRRCSHAVQRAAAWTHFTNASRQLHKAVHQPSPAQGTATTPLSSYAAGYGYTQLHVTPSAVHDVLSNRVDQDDEDEALAALAPSIVCRTTTAAASATLMRELGVIDHAEYRPTTVKEETTTTSTATATARGALHASSSLSSLAPYLSRVCQTGVQARVPCCVILKHLWSPFQPLPQRTATMTSTTDVEGRQRKRNAASADAAAPTLEWSASLPSSVRLQLISHATSQITQRRTFLQNELQGRHATRLESVPATAPTRATLSKTWQQTILEAHAVLHCCAAPWLLGDQRSSSSVGSHTAVAALLSASERNVLLASLQLAATCQAEDMGQKLMEVFLRSVDALVQRSGNPAADEAVEAEEQRVESFEAWYEVEGIDVYEAAMRCVAQQRCHAPTVSTALPLGDGFARAYGFLVHRATTAAQLSRHRRRLERSDDDVVHHHDSSNGSAVSSTSSPPPTVSGSVWTAALTEYPAATMRLLQPLADCVDTNADHFDVVVQLYLRLLVETDVAYSTNLDGAATALVSSTFAALLVALSRVQLEPGSRATFLENLYRQTLLNSPLEVVQTADILAGCLRVCSAAGVASRSTSLFNKLAEPASRAIAFKEENIAAACLVQVEHQPAAVLQRCFSYLQVKLPVTADVLHASAVAALLSDVSLNSTATTTVSFAMLDLLTGDVAQNRVTRGTAALTAERTFFIRVLILLARVREEQQQQLGVPTSLRTPTAVAVFEEWVRSLALSLGAAAHALSAARASAVVAPSLSLVTVGVLQELCIALQRGEDHSSSAAVGEHTSAVPLVPTRRSCPLVEAVRRLLGCVPPPVETSVRATTMTSLPASAGVLTTLPSAFQFRQLRDVWPLQQREAFVDAVAALFCSATPVSVAPAQDGEGRSSSSSRAVCMRYQDYKLLEEFCTSAIAAVEASSAGHVWSTTTPSLPPAPSSLQALMARRVTGCADGGAVLHVLSPLAEVDWWVRQHRCNAAAAGPTNASPNEETRSLSLLLGVAVPPVVGCPAHTWAAEDVSVTAMGKRAPSARTQSTVAAYWLRRWVDAVEDACVLPAHSLFRNVVSAKLDRLSIAAVPSWTIDNTSTEKREEDEDRHRQGGKVAVASTTTTGDSTRSGEKRSGLAELFVHGPTSLVYKAV